MGLLQNQSISLIYMRFILFPSASDLLSIAVTLSLCRAHYVIICEHVFAGLDIFLGGRVGQCHCYLQRMFSKDSEEEKRRQVLT